MAQIFKPMLAGRVESDDDIVFPLYASPKLDGIRCIIKDGKALSRKLKPIPNHHIRRRLEDVADLIEGFDGELMLRKKKATFQEISSAVMSHEGEPDFVFHVFDDLRSDKTFAGRFADLGNRVFETWEESDLTKDFIRLVPHWYTRLRKELDALEAKWLKQGYEGVMLRDPHGPYKFGRSTAREGYLLKLKRFQDAEAVIIGFEEQEQNINAAKRDATGALKRSNHKAGKVGKGTLGAFVVTPYDEAAEHDMSFPPRHKHSDDVFRIGTGLGLTQGMRQVIWDNQKRYIGKIVKYRYQEQGTKDAPRIPSFLGFRDEVDL